MGKIKIAPFDRQTFLIFVRADGLVSAENAFEVAENGRGTLADFVEKFPAALVAQWQEIPVECVIKPAAGVIRILRVIEALIQMAGMWSDASVRLDNMPVAKKPEKQCAANQRKDICPANFISDTINALIQQIEHFVEHTVRIGGLFPSVNVTECEP
jgi:hypothetical protein